MAYSNQIREEELKNRIAEDWFSKYDTTRILGNVDFSVALPPDLLQAETEYLLWAEAKKGTKSSIEESFVQLIITIGKARTFEKHLPPKFLGAFDSEKMAFIQYNQLLELFYQNDFNWNITPSDHSTKEFSIVFEAVKDCLNQEMLIFNYDDDGQELEKFIKQNFVIGKSALSKIRISKNNFVSIYQKWLKEVRPTIAIKWDEAKKIGIIDADFYLADILSEHNVSLRDKLYVLLRDSYYELDRKRNDFGMFTSSKAFFTDRQKTHTQFWNKYARPPKREYWDYIVSRRDLLVPPDVRERKGSYFTPQIWVDLSQQYIADELGENWQDDYYIWDCAAGTGNLLNGLLDKYKIWASTLDKADVDVMHDTINNGANLLPSHVFQFDFLNDSFDKLPDGLRDIINDEDKRKKLIIYINPPYAEAATTKQITGTGKNKTKVAVQTMVYSKYHSLLGIAGRELYAQFLIRIFHEIPGAVVAHFSTTKNILAPNFRIFRQSFQAELKSVFLVPADTFDNVSGSFPIGFFVWRLCNDAKPFSEITADVYDKSGQKIGQKTLATYDGLESINDWIIKTRKYSGTFPIGFLSAKGCDFQNANSVFIINDKSQLPHPRGTMITSKNIREIAIYLAVRKAIVPSWVNDRDQYLHPNDLWKHDAEFQNDCLAFTLFENRISATHGTNHWIPFPENDVNAQDCYESHFMIDYISGKNRPQADLFDDESTPQPLHFSAEATAVMDAGRELWRYYHSKDDANPNASFYDIKVYFQGTKVMKSGKLQMKSSSEDAHYTALLKNLRDALKELAKHIEPKVYQYGFLK